MTEGIAVPHLPLPDERHRLDPAVRVIREAGPVVGGLGRIEVIEQEERVEVIEPPGADAAPEVHPGTLDDRFRRRDDLGHSSSSRT